MNKIWNLEKFGNHIAMIDDNGNEVTYEELENISKILINKTNHRSLIFVLCQNVIESVVGYAAFINNGMVPLLLNSHQNLDLLFNLIQVYLPEYLWIPAEKISDFQEYEEVYTYNSYSLLKTNFSKSYALYDDLGLLLTTSGSTGSPKFVRQSYENVKNNANAIANYLELDENERPITTLPMNYTYGLSIINSHFMVGATLLLTEKGLMQKEFWEFFRAKEATSFGGVPYTYEMLDKLRFYTMKLPSLKTMTQAGGKLVPDLHEKFAKYAGENGKKFIVMYGQCEATARMGYLPWQKSLEKKGSMGIAIPGGKFILTRADGTEETEVFTTGELVYEGKNVTLGYAECGEDLIKGDERHGRLETGDMAQKDADGFYYIVGRKKRFLKIYGNRVNLDEIDRLVKEKFGIEFASTGVDDHMYLFVLEDKYATPVKEYLVEVTKLNPAAFQTITISEIPKNDAGKTLYKELEKYYES